MRRMHHGRTSIKHDYQGKTGQNCVNKACSGSRFMLPFLACDDKSCTRSEDLLMDRIISEGKTRRQCIFIFQESVKLILYWYQYLQWIQQMVCFKFTFERWLRATWRSDRTQSMLSYFCFFIPRKSGQLPLQETVLNFGMYPTVLSI